MTYQASGNEFRVNSGLPGAQVTPAVASLAGGGFVALWTSNTGGGDDVRGRIYDASGVQAGPEFTINATTAGNQGAASVSALPDGGFVVAWCGPDSDQNGIYAQRFNAAGTPVGAELGVNTTTAGIQADVSVSARPDGGFVVSWTTYNAANARLSTQAARFDSANNRLGAEMQITAPVQIPTLEHDSAVLASGDMVVGYNDGIGGLFIARYTISGTNGGNAALAGRSQINDPANSLGMPGDLSLVALEGGGFAAVWMHYTNSGGFVGTNGIFARLFDSAGNATSGVLTVAGSGHPAMVSNLTLSALDDGGFAVGWTEYVDPSNPALDTESVVQTFDASGASTSAVLQVNSTTAGVQLAPALAGLSDGGFVAIFEDRGTDPFNQMSGEIRAQIFREAASIEGTAGDDTLTGTSGSDTIAAGAGNDTVELSAGADTVNGGSGNDRLQGYATDLALPSGAHSYTLIATRFSDLSGTIDTQFTGIEQIFFAERTGANIVFDASALAGASLHLETGAGTHQLTGSAGADSFLLEGGHVTLDAGGGTDSVTLRFDYGWAPMAVSQLGGVVIFTQSGVEQYRVSNAEQIRVSAVGPLNIDASATDLALDFIGSNGNSHVIGSSAGNRFLGSWSGNGDVFTGGGGADTYLFDHLSSFGGTTITDLDVDDSIDLRAQYGSAISFIGSTGFTGVAGEVRYRAQGTQTLMEADSDGDGDADYTLLISNGAFILAEGPNAGVLRIVGQLPAGHDGPNHLIGTEDADILDSGAGNDLVEGLGGDDRISGGTGDDEIHGGAGIDAVHGADGADEIHGDAGADQLYGDEGDDTIDGGGDADTIEGGAGNDLIEGDTGNDSLHGNAGDDELRGGEGNDRLSGDTGHDLLIGGIGSDEYFVNDSAVEVRENDAEGYDTLYLSVSYVLAAGQSIESVNMTLRPIYEPNTRAIDFTGNEFNQTVAGSEGANVIHGGGGSDTIRGYGGDDTLFGDAGFDALLGGYGRDALYGGDNDDNLDGSFDDDRLNGGAGNDLLEGGAGNDIADYSDAAAGVKVDLAIVGAQDTGGSGSDTLRNVENLAGSAFSDGLVGNMAANRIDGNDGQDWLDGGGGNDIETGGEGHDSLWGGDGDDLLDGGAGDDTIFGGAGIDTVSYTAATAGIEIDLSWLEEQLTRGAGVDTLVSIENVIGSFFDDVLAGNADANVLSGGGGNDRFVFAGTGARDTIADFTSGDVIDLSAIDANGAAAGDAAFAFIGATGFGGVAGQLRATGSGTSWLVEADLNGDGVADFSIAVTTTIPVSGLAASDFLV